MILSVISNFTSIHVSVSLTLIKSLVLKNDISVIYITKFKYENINFHYIDDLFENCSKEKIILEQLSSYNIENCN